MRSAPLSFAISPAVPSGALTGTQTGMPSGATRGRRAELWAMGLALFFQTGAISVLAFSGADGNLTTTGQRALQLMALPVYAVTLVLLARHPRAFRAVIRANLLLVALASLACVSVLWSISPMISLRRAVALGFSVLLAAAIAMRCTPRQFLLLVALVSGAGCGLSLMLLMASPHFAHMPQGHAATGMRGVFNHKNVLGWIAAIALLTGSMLVAERGGALRRLGLVIALAGLVCLGLSRSATAMMMTVSGVGFIGFYLGLRRTRGSGRVLLILVSLQILMAVLLAPDALMQLVFAGTDKDPSLSGRVPLWALVDQAIARRSAMGYGYGAFWTEGNGEAWDIWTRVAWMAPHAHNGYRDTLLHLGVLGLVIVVWLAIRALRGAAIRYCASGGIGWLWINVLIGVFLVMNLTESVLLAQNNFLFILFMVALIMSAHAADGAQS